jgi:hypothetical protein
MNEKLILDLLQLSLLRSKNKKQNCAGQRIKIVRKFHAQKRLTHSEMIQEVRAAAMFAM